MGEGNREEMASEWVLANRDAERDLLGCIPGKDLGARETGDYGNMVDDLGLSLEPLVSGSVMCLCPGHFSPLLIMAHKENDT